MCSRALVDSSAMRSSDDDDPLAESPRGKRKEPERAASPEQVAAPPANKRVRKEGKEAKKKKSKKPKSKKERGTKKMSKKASSDDSDASESHG